VHVILRNSKSEVKFEDLGNIYAEYIGVKGYRKGHFIRFEVSME
jgi:hypothetical protein